MRASSAAAHRRSSLQLRSPYSPVETPGGFRKVTFGFFSAHAQARRAASSACAANSVSNGLYTRPAIAPTAARSAVAHVLLKGSESVPITSLGSVSSCGAIKPEKCVLVCLCHTPPSSSCIFSIHSRFQRASFNMSGVPLPVSGIFN